MPRLRRVSGAEALRALERLGFVQVRQRGSHVVLKKQTPEGEWAVWCHYTANWRLVRCVGSYGRPESPPTSSWTICSD